MLPIDLKPGLYSSLRPSQPGFLTRWYSGNSVDMSSPLQNLYPDPDLELVFSHPSTAGPLSVPQSAQEEVPQDQQAREEGEIS